MNITEYLTRPMWGGIKWDLALEKRLEDERFLEKFGYKVYSQNDEDGIINEIFNRIGTGQKTFVEFGVDKGLECNSHALLLQGWKGLWIEGNNNAFKQIQRRFAPAIRQGKLEVENKYITVENINEIIGAHYTGEIDFLSIDIDGNDWYVWDAVDIISPRVICIEYNGKFTPEINWKMAYNADHIWDGTDRSGASLKSLEELGLKKGYQLVGTNIVGINAFFVRKDLTKDMFPIPATAENLYNPQRMQMLRSLIGHPSRNYVGQDIEGMEGVFEYYPDWNTYPSFGFHRIEVLESGKRINTIAQKEAAMYAKVEKEANGKIVIKYDTKIDVAGSDDNKRIGDLTIEVSVNDGEKYWFEIKDREGEMVIDTNEVYAEGDILKLTFFSKVLWNEHQMLNNGRNRTVGITIVDVSVE